MVSMGIVRKYKSYSEYIDHQKEKTTDPERRKKWLNEEWLPKLAEFKQCFSSFLGDNLKGKWCLGVCARTGQEIQALKDLGADAIGIDLVPCEPLVKFGDMHNMPFSDNEFDIVFCNSIDHSLYPEKFVSEVRRVLIPQGLALLFLRFYTVPYKERKQDYDICEFETSEELINLFGDVEVLENRSFCCLGSSWLLLLRII